MSANLLLHCLHDFIFLLRAEVLQSFRVHPVWLQPSAVCNNSHHVSRLVTRTTGVQLIEGNYIHMVEHVSSHHHRTGGAPSKETISMVYGVVTYLFKLYAGVMIITI